MTARKTSAPADRAKWLTQLGGLTAALTLLTTAGAFVVAAAETRAWAAKVPGIEQQVTTQRQESRDALSEIRAELRAIRTDLEWIKRKVQ